MYHYKRQEFDNFVDVLEKCKVLLDKLSTGLHLSPAHPQLSPRIPFILISFLLGLMSFYDYILILIYCLHFSWGPRAQN